MDIKRTCENCNKKTDYDIITLEHGYGSQYDGEVWNFCSIKCLLIYCNVIAKEE